MALQFNAFAPGTFAFARGINLDPFIAPDLEQTFPGEFLFLIDSLQLKGIKPNAATAPFAHVHHQAADLHLL